MHKDISKLDSVLSKE